MASWVQGLHMQGVASFPSIFCSYRTAGSSLGNVLHGKKQLVLSYNIMSVRLTLKVFFYAREILFLGLIQGNVESLIQDQEGWLPLRGQRSPAKTCRLRVPPTALLPRLELIKFLYTAGQALKDIQKWQYLSSSVCTAHGKP